MTKTVVAYYNPYTKTKHHYITSGEGCDRQVEALRGQGCKVYGWDLEYWSRGYKNYFYRNDGKSIIDHES